MSICDGTSGTPPIRQYGFDSSDGTDTGTQNVTAAFTTVSYVDPLVGTGHSLQLDNGELVAHQMFASGAGLPGGSTSRSFTFWLASKGIVLLQHEPPSGISETLALGFALSVGGIALHTPGGAVLDYIIIPASTLGVAVDDGSRHHYAIVYDYTGETMTLYLDGASVSSTAIAGATFTDVTDSFFEVLATGAILDDLRIYDYALTPTNVSDLAIACGATLPTPPVPPDIPPDSDPASIQLLINGDFEAGDVIWTHGSDWTISEAFDPGIHETLTPISGLWGAFGYLDAGTFGEIRDLYQVVTLPSGFTTATISFDYTIALYDDNAGDDENHFFCLIQSPDGSTTLQTVLAAKAEIPTSLTHVAVDVSAYAGQSVRVAFRIVTPTFDTGTGIVTYVTIDNVRLVAALTGIPGGATSLSPIPTADDGLAVVFGQRLPRPMPY